MELKRILARDSRSANEKAIQLYGNDVLIISSQRLDNQIELIVATDVDPAMSLAVDSPVQQGETSVPSKAQKPFVPFSQMLDEVNTRQDLDDSDDGVSKNHEKWPSAPTVSSLSPVISGEHLSHGHESQRSLEIVDMLRQEMASLRKEFTLSRQMQPWQDGLRLSPAIQPLFQAMNEAGVPAALRALLTDSIQSLDSVGEAMAVMQHLLITSLHRPTFNLQPKLVHALCGPSGAGKTSMVGRLAHSAAQKEGAEKQAMVSFADHRPGAWAQMQLLASQSGVDCYRVADAAMLGTLLEDLHGRTVWIDTCGADFSAQAEVLQLQCPQVLRHAVLPVDATVTSVQKILQNPTAHWSSLMLSKVDEAAHPWALVKGLTENSLPVSWMAGDSRIALQAKPFDATVLVQLALKPMANLLGADVAVPTHSEVLVDLPKPAVRSKKAATSPSLKQKTSTPPELKTQRVKTGVSEEIEIPTSMRKSLSLRPRNRSNSSVTA